MILLILDFERNLSFLIHTGRPRTWYQVLPVVFFSMIIPDTNFCQKNLENLLTSKKGDLVPC
jgi:hypothetical protein